MRGAVLSLMLISLGLVGCGGGPTQTAASSPAVVTTHDPGDVPCPAGKAAKSGLDHFGAYVGTWQSIHTQDPLAPTVYTINGVPGRIIPRCSTDDFVIAEQIRLDAPTDAANALKIAMAELPGDQKQVYDHTHSTCRTLQYQSAQLARQLGADDNDGRVGVRFDSQTPSYDPTVIDLIVLDVFDSLGADTSQC